LLPCCLFWLPLSLLFERLALPGELEGVDPPILLTFSFSFGFSGFFVVGITEKIKRLTFWLIAYMPIKSMPNTVILG